MNKGQDIDDIVRLSFRLEMEREKNKRRARRDILIGMGIFALGSKVLSIVEDETIKHTHNDYYKDILKGAKEEFKLALSKFLIDKNLIDNILNSIVIINNGKGAGTGFFITDRFILTAAHVISDVVDMKGFNYSEVKKPYSIYDLEGNKYKAKRVYGDRRNDLGCIMVAESGQGKINVWNKNLRNNPERISIGFGGGKPHTTTGKVVVSFKNMQLGVNKESKLDHTGQVEFVSNRLIKGDSGGPILDKYGLLRGVTIHEYPLTTEIVDNKTRISFNANVNYGGIEPLNDIQGFLDEIFKLHRLNK